MDGETKTYIDITNDGKAALVTENPVSVFNYVAETNIWSTTNNGTAYYLGTYYDTKNNKSFTTISASKASYVTAENTGDTQYPAGFAIMEVVVENAHTHEFADATCTAPKTCECGATEGEALGHNIVEKVCTGCGAKVVTVTEAAALADGTLVFIEATVSKITYAWSDSAKNMSVDLTDGTTTLNAYKLATKVGAGDVIVIYGKVSSYNGTKQIAAGATAEIKTAHTCTTYTEGKCPVCGADEPSSNKLTYVMGTVFGTSENITTTKDVTTADGKITYKLVANNVASNKDGTYRVYQGKSGVITSTVSITALEFTGKGKDGGATTVTISVSNDGVTYTDITTTIAVSAEGTYSIDLGGSYKYIKITSANKQLQIKEMTFTIAEE